MNDWQIICKLKDAGATNDEAGWRGIDVVLFGLLRGQATREEALEALRAGGVQDPERALAEVTR